MCRVLKQFRSGYYAWCNRPASARTQENAILSHQIQHIYDTSRQSYGSPRIKAALVAQGWTISRQRVLRLMAKLGISARSKRKFKVTTDSKHAWPIAENHLDRDFTTTEPDRVWVADMTYIWTAVIIDLFSRRVVGWSMAEHMRTEVVLTALAAALGQRQPDLSGLLFHSDRGSQYASGEYQEALQQATIRVSMSLRGNCWDNAVAESFFGTLKTELIHPRIFSTRTVARTVIAEWIEVFHNRQRLHSTLGYLSPVQFEDNYWLSLEGVKAA
jgi:transposase InsO family protein